MSYSYFCTTSTKSYFDNLKEREVKYVAVGRYGDELAKRTSSFTSSLIPLKRGRLGQTSIVSNSMPKMYASLSCRLVLKTFCGVHLSRYTHRHTHTRQLLYYDACYSYFIIFLKPFQTSQMNNCCLF
jgi:hypothetical protein